MVLTPEHIEAANIEAAVAAGSSTDAMVATPSALCGLLNSFVDALTEEREVMANAELGSGDQLTARSAPALHRDGTGAQRRAPSPSEDNHILSAVSMEVNEKLIAENGRLRSEIRHFKLVAELEHEKAPTATLERERRLLLKANGELTEECSRLGDECNDTHQRLTAALVRENDLEAMCETLQRQLDKPTGPGQWASPIDRRWAPGVTQEPPSVTRTPSGGRARKVSSGSVGSSRNPPGSSRNLPGSPGQPSSKPAASATTSLSSKPASAPRLRAVIERIAESQRLSRRNSREI